MARIPWYEWQNIRNRLLIFGRTVQGAAPYRVLIESDPAKCRTGFCDFTHRRIAVNPTLFPDLRPKAAFQITKALLAHEAGHRRFTTPITLNPLVHTVTNILEDERIERLMADEFAGVRGLLELLRSKMYAESSPLEPSDDPGQVVTAALQYRWAKALGEPLKGTLSAINQARWDRVRPLVEAAWEEADTVAVSQIAQRIVDILGLEELEIPSWVKDLAARLGEIGGTRQEGDAAEATIPRTGVRDAATAAHEPEPAPFDGEVPPDDHPAGSGDYPIEPKPYRELEERVQPLVRSLLEELATESIPDDPIPGERGGRLSLRQVVRDRRHPFLLRDEDRPAPPTLALRVIVDHSTSTNVTTTAGRSRIESVAEAVLALHLVCTELQISHAIAVTPQQEILADLFSGERGKALLAGLVPAQTGWEDIAKAIDRHARALATDDAGRKIVLVIHDGYPNDAEEARRLIESLTGQIEVMGVLLDPDDSTREAMRGIFGDRLIACASVDLPRRLGSVLRGLAGTC